MTGANLQEGVFDFEAIFQARYERIARLIARVARDPARAEEIAVEVFWKLWRHPQVGNRGADAWLYRTAIRLGLDELRRQTRRSRFERLFGVCPVPTPEGLRMAAEEKQRVRAVLGTMGSRAAGLLLLRSDGLSYGELASALEMNAASVGTLLSRAKQGFRKEYIKRYGEP